MPENIYTFNTTIQQSHLDHFGHMNNAVYLTLFEQARWDIINNNHYGLKEIQEAGVAPTILEIKIRFLREILLNDSIKIETQFISYVGKICKLSQRILRGDIVCCTAEFTIALFDLKKRKLVSPTPEWLKAIGMNQ